MSIILSPSLLSADFSCLGKECSALEDAGVPWVHLDIMDGHFAPNITFGAPVIKSIRSSCSLFFDAHLMVEEPECFFESFADAGVNLLTPHIEALKHPQKALAQIRELGIKAGIALNPDTDLSCLRWLLPDLDLILIMSVNPGFSGQSFIPQIYDKITACRTFIHEFGYDNIAIEVDGGVNLHNAALLKKAGANILVSGSAFFNFNNHLQAYESFTNEMEEI